MLCMLFISASATAFGQAEEKQQMFASLPQNFSLSGTALSNSFDVTTGTEVSINLAPELTFKGKVLSNRKRSEDVKTVMIRSVNNALLQITEVTDKKNNISYTGRIIGENFADGYEIKHTNGQYSMQKFEIAKIFERCGP